MHSNCANWKVQSDEEEACPEHPPPVPFRPLRMFEQPFMHWLRLDKPTCGAMEIRNHKQRHELENYEEYYGLGEGGNVQRENIWP